MDDVSCNRITLIVSWWLPQLSNSCTLGNKHHSAIERLDFSRSTISRIQQLLELAFDQALLDLKKMEDIQLLYANFFSHSSRKVFFFSLDVLRTFQCKIFYGDEFFNRFEIVLKIRPAVCRRVPWISRSADLSYCFNDVPEMTWKKFFHSWSTLNIFRQIGCWSASA